MNWKKIIWLGFLILVVCIAAFDIIIRGVERGTNDSKIVVETIADLKPLKSFKPTTTPFPFQELTIPYLRSITYESSLGEMKKLSENVSYISYRTSYNSDGLKVYGLLTVPKNGKAKHPAIVFVHGYIAPTVYKTERNYASYVAYLAKRGFVVFKIDLRGHDQSEGEAGGAYYSGDYVVDTLNAYRALQSAPFVESGKVGLWGHSMAGNITFRSFVVKKDIPAVVIWAGAGYTYEDLQKYGIDDNSYRPPDENSERAKKRRELAEKYGAFDPYNWFWKLVPATNFLDGVTGAIQLNHAVDDAVVDVSYSRDLMDILDKTSIIHELNEFSSGGHNISGASFASAMANTVSFFEKHLK